MALALYLRLSLEDDLGKESDSITNQRQLLKSFVAAHPQLKGEECIEIIDDGYSGTSLARPGLVRLLELAEHAQISCIVVKDLSRFARNYIEAGYYLEEYFPAKGLRFISVNDGYDSFAHATANQGLDMAFRNLLYDLYSKDLSAKVRSAREAKMKKGEYLSPYAIYGYVKSKEGQNTLEVDPEAAAVVREIFKMICTGYSATQTAKLLNQREIPTPMQYKQQRSTDRSWSKHKTNLWTKDGVMRMIRDRRYTGDMASNKRKRRDAGGTATAKVPPEEWLIVPGTHPAIISHEQYAQAQEMLLDYRQIDKSIDKSRLLYGRVICGSCGHILRYKKGSSPYYFCETSRYAAASCSNTQRILREDLEQAILMVLRNQLKLLCDLDHLTQRCQRQALEALSRSEGQYKQLQAQGQSLSGSKISLYESYRKEAITKDQYLARRDALDRCHRELLPRLSALESQIKALSSQRLGIEECSARYMQDAFLPKLSAEVASAAVEWVKVYDGQSIQLKLRAADCFTLHC